MAKRRRKSKMKLARRIVTTRDEFGLGAVARHGAGYSGRNAIKRFHTVVEVDRDIGASTKNQYRAHACVVGRGPRRAHGYTKRCGGGRGRTPTAAAKKALRALASNLK